MSEDYKPKRIIVPQRRGQISEIIVTPSISTVLDEAVSIITTEILNYKNMVNKGKGLDQKQARILQGHIKCLVDLSKESREHDNERDLANMSDEELATLVETLRDKRKKEEDAGKDK